MPHRFYSRDFARWLSPDPMGGNVMNPQSFNRYAYALNNPATFNDPLGLYVPSVPPPYTIDVFVGALAPRPEIQYNTDLSDYEYYCGLWGRCSLYGNGSSFGSRAGVGGSIGPSAAPAGRPETTAASKQSCLGAKYANFFSSEYPAALPVAEQYNVGVSLLLALAAHESGWGTSSMAIKQYNPFGATPGGDSTRGLSFSSFSAAWQWWGNRFGSVVQGVGGNVGAFTNDLFSVGYNSEQAPSGDPNWATEVANTVSGVKGRLNQWLNGAPTCGY